MKQSSTVVVEFSSLDAAAAEIRQLDEECRNSAGRALIAAMAAGDRLAEVKSQLAHGEYQKFVEEGCKLPYRTAATYAQLAKNRLKIESQMCPGETHLTVNAARKLIAGPPRKAKSPPAVDETPDWTPMEQIPHRVKFRLTDIAFDYRYLLDELREIKRERAESLRKAQEVLGSKFHEWAKAEFGYEEDEIQFVTSDAYLAE